MTRHGFRRLFHFTARSRRDIAQDVDDEFAFHLDMRTADLQARGLTAQAARAQALREFGDHRTGARACAREDAGAEDRRRLRRMAADFRQDVRFAARLAAVNPAFSAVVVLTLAVAIGGNTAVFSVANALLLKPLPVHAPEQLVRIYPGESTMSWPNIEDLRDRTTTFSDIFAQRATVSAFDAGSGPTRITGTSVTPNYFTALGVPALAGRLFTPADTRTDVVVISERLWRRHFDGSAAAIGRVVRIDGRRHEIVAVMPRSFRGVAAPGFPRDLWTPLDFNGTERRIGQDRSATAFQVYGRRLPGVTTAQASAEVRVAAQALKALYPDSTARFDGMRLMPISGISGFQGMQALLPVFAFLALLAIIAGLVLLVGCANIAGLLLGRAAARRREIAVRLSLGAGRGRLIRQLLTETLLLAVAGGAAGVALSIWLAGLLPAATAALPFPVEFDLSVDWHVVAFAVALACCAALLSGLAPARRAARTDVAHALKLDGGGAGRQRLRSILVVGQIAVCSALLVWGGLFARSLANVARLDPGFDPTAVLAVDVPRRPGDGDDDQSRLRAAREFADLVHTLPGVQSAGRVFAVPLALMSRAEFSVRLPAPDGSARIARVMSNTVSPGYFETLRIPLRHGRDFTWQDRPGGPDVVLVNETAAAQFWNGDAVGRTIELADEDRWMPAEVVGVVADSKYWTIGEEVAPVVYRHYGQDPMGGTVLVRTTTMGDTRVALAAELRRLAPDEPIDVRPLTEVIAVATMPARVGAVATTSFGALAMALSGLGIYGMVAFSVTQRMREMGIRRALGARTSDIVVNVLRGSAGRAIVGLAIGVVTGSLAASLFAGFIVGVSNFDAPTLAGVAALVLGATVAASLGPALRATRIDPVTALRME